MHFPRFKKTPWNFLNLNTAILRMRCQPPAAGCGGKGCGRAGRGGRSGSEGSGGGGGSEGGSGGGGAKGGGSGSGARGQM